MSLTVEEKVVAIKECAVLSVDIGSSEVRPALSTKQINKLTGHLKAHVHDFIISHKNLMRMFQNYLLKR